MEFDPNKEDFREQMIRMKGENYWHWEHFIFPDNIKLSVQANAYVYCKPKYLYIDARKYIEFEVAFFKNNKMVDPSTIWTDFNISWIENWDMGTSTAAYVPFKTVEGILKFIHKKTLK